MRLGRLACVLGIVLVTAAAAAGLLSPDPVTSGVAHGVVASTALTLAAAGVLSFLLVNC